MIEEGLVIISPWDHFARLPPALWPSFACLAAVSLLSSNTNTKPSVHSTKKLGISPKMQLEVPEKYVCFMKSCLWWDRLT